MTARVSSRANSKREPRSETGATTEAKTRSKTLHIIVALAAILAFSGFVALGNWQMDRLSWKRSLIDRVESRVTSPAVPAPEPGDWARVSRAEDEYRRVSAVGHYLNDNDTLVAAATELGTGYWVLTPLRLSDGGVVLINRGYIHQGTTPAPAPEGAVSVVGLLRMSEPGGGILRDNRPAQGRWYSRDVAAIASAQNLTAAPYFIDAEAGQPGSPGGEGPVGGLTVIRFHNNHLVYAITWYALAAMVLGAGWLVWRESRRRDP